MATLVLTVVGTAVAGPIGGAIGGAVGSAIDRRLFATVREGPRLTELHVQTSSYGTPIPRLFGTMRVAGTVIWSTDLVESRSRGGGKGSPVARYSYSASFAVLLSGRAIEGVGRIWADGRLIRGSAGDLKVKATLRIHLGGEDQAPDPLIAAAEGVCPAYRGAAYLVWEDLPLAEFGNRIPQLTVEVVADPGPVQPAAIARALAGEVAGTDAGGAVVHGFAASGSVRGALAVLAQTAGGWWAPDGAGLRLCRDTGPAALLVDEGASAAGLKGPARLRETRAIEQVPRAVSLGHYDPARDYQAGVQRAGTGGVAERIELPAAIDAGAARTLAGELLAVAGAERVRRTVTTGFAGIATAPGAVVTLDDAPGRWRVIEAGVEAMAARLVLVPLASTMPAAGAATSGRAVLAADMVMGATLLHAAELPGLDDMLATAPRLTVVAAGEGAGWRQATLLWSADDGASWTEAGATGASGVLGRVEAAAAAVPAGLRDRHGEMVVALAHADMMLVDADDAALDRGANLAMAGGELLQFARAMPLGGGRWRLSGLLRGRRGTEGHVAGTGDRFALLGGDSVRVIELPLAALGRTVRLMAAGVGDDEPVELAVPLTGASVAPPAPVHLTRTATGVRWVRRSRAGWGWRDGGDVPLGEETEAYRITLVEPDGAAREVETTAPVLNGAIAPGTRVTVRQRGTWAESAPVTGMF